MTANIQRLTMALAIAFVVTALMVSFWGVVRSAALLAREDNPRLVDTELSIQRGQILDRNGVPLAISLPDNGFLTRSYPNLEAAGVVGYYSLRFGVGGIEAAYDDVLRGEAFIDSEGQRIANRLLHRPQIGGDVRLTIDLAIQQVAEEALTEQRGALVVVDVESGDILAMTSSPTFDPNRVDDSWESLLDDPDAPLVNRVTQGLYNPGTALQSVLLAAALNAGEVDLQAPIVPDQLKATVGTGQFTLNCALTPDAPLETLLDAYQWGCPAPFIEIGNALGRQRFDGALQDFGLTTAVLLGLSPDLVADVQAPQSSDLNELVLGHADLQVTPLQMALVAAAIANHGEAPALRLVDAIRPPDGDWQSLPGEGHPRAAVSRETADLLAGAMQQTAISGGDGIVVSGHMGLALAGDEGKLNAWFIGFAAGDDGKLLAVAVLLEDVQDASDAGRIGQLVLAAALGL